MRIITLNRLITDEDGTDLIEYALLAGLLSLACFLTMTAVGTNLNNVFNALGTMLSGVLP